MKIIVRYTETCSEAQTGEAYHKLHWRAVQTVFVTAEPRAALRPLTCMIILPLLFGRSYSGLPITPHAIRGGAPLFVSLLTS
jgi:hypothetical protein